MKRFFDRLFSKASPSRASAMVRRCSLGVEELESRTLMSVTSLLGTGIIVQLPPPNTILNGNFTAPALAAGTYQYDPTGTAWTFNGQAGVSANGSGFTNGNPCSPAGTQAGFLQQAGCMSQSVNFTSGTYSLSFLDAQRANVQSHFQAFNIQVDGKLVDVVIPSCTQYTTHQTPNFNIATTGQHTITFAGVNPLGGDNTAFLTAIQIKPAGISNSDSPVIAQALASGSINYGSMLGLFSTVEADGTVTAAELQQLQTVVADAGVFHTPDYVSNLASKVVFGDSNNATYRTLDSMGNQVATPLGNLQAGSTAWQLTALANKWFLGIDYPAAGAPFHVAHSGTTPITNLFNPATNVPSPADVVQGDLGDCWVMASYMEAAQQMPGLVSSMFTSDGTNGMENVSCPSLNPVNWTSTTVPMQNGVWTVRFYQNGKPTYVTVDAKLPDGGSLYDHPNGNLWAALAEKAYAQYTSHSYISIGNGGWAETPMAQITGRGIWERHYTTSNGVVLASDSTNLSWDSIFGGSVEQTSEDHLAGMVSAAFNAGQLVTFATVGSPPNSQVIGDHAYALLGIGPNNTSFTLGNPWGTGSVTLSLDELFHNTEYLAFTQGTGPLQSISSGTGTTAAAPIHKTANANFMLPASSIAPVNQLASSAAFAAVHAEAFVPQHATTAGEARGLLTLAVSRLAGKDATAGDWTRAHLDAVFGEPMLFAEIS